MPNPGADRPLRKVTLNLYEEDCQIFEREYGNGWTTKIRDAIRIHVQTLRMSEWTKPKRRLGDIHER